MVPRVPAVLLISSYILLLISAKQAPLSKCAIVALGGFSSSSVHCCAAFRTIGHSGSRFSAALLAASLAALQTRQPLSSLLVAAPGVSLLASPRIILSWRAPCGTPACCRTRAPTTVFVHVVIIHVGELYLTLAVLILDPLALVPYLSSFP
ncbi:hypothetical protein EMIHUDRAFT_224825 [Emiliania huxleyi CCMP1516]|uniref:Secreted protein n=2 Tax=Emiliania huxleyi TaxID=2903 RepID=A0A0D3KRK2_EMIH1|nr:hypothetical protein EMIHUDRAFT_224825 [Emiliania huxleyi CCMP1516]EOD38387.1 hypothetical protein EMIHUDRAFT_224825 [Emiliania huxleyi CCMP1516]|eukprot:XP_005790816.1 hypothetical protein EMIHUDRAFT_224825 [Emiliania huxleyi CCMP1516]